MILVTSIQTVRELDGSLSFPRYTVRVYPFDGLAGTEIATVHGQSLSDQIENAFKICKAFDAGADVHVKSIVETATKLEPADSKDLRKLVDQIVADME